ncbi:TPA: hypothetical protein ACPSFQ_001106 [Haemophilus influenzae]
MQKFTDVFTEIIPFLCKTAIAFAIAFLIGGIAHCFVDEPTDWHDNELSQQIQQETRCELKGGIYENGVCLPPNLTLAAEKELQDYTAQKQAEINRTLGEKQ